jgi:hypothetical protein
MKRFTDYLSTLELTNHIEKIHLCNPMGEIAGIIENKPGSQGSVRVYHHLFKKWGLINKEAAKEGLKIYAEHTLDAEENPGKHPNIDRLFTILETGETLNVVIFEIQSQS